MRSPPAAVGPRSSSSPLARAFASRTFAECQGAARGASASLGPFQRHHAAATAVLAAAARSVAAAGARTEVLGAHGKSRDALPPFSVVPRGEPTLPSGTRLHEQVARRSSTGGSGRVPRHVYPGSRATLYVKGLLVLLVQDRRELACGSARSPPLWVGRDGSRTRIWATYAPQLF